MILNGEHTGLADQIRAGLVSHVYMQIGANDFAPWNGTYELVYDGTLAGAQLQAKLDQILADMTTAVDTLLAAGPVELIIANEADQAISR